jgi:branched-chain amino acid transport system substrate-binding protein
MNHGTKVLGWIVLAVIVLGGGWWVLSHKGNNVSQNGPIKIGFIGPLTGDAATYGQPFQQTVQLAVEQINTVGGISGRQVEVIYEDGKCNGKDAASATQKLVNVDHVQAIIGGFCSGETIPSVPIAAQGKVLVLSPSASSPALTGISPFFFRDYPSDSTQGKVLATIAYTDKSWKNVAFIQEETDYAAGIYKAFDQTFAGLGGKTTNDSFPSTSNDFRSILTKLKAANPDAVFIDVQTGAAADRILKQMEAMGWKPHLFLSDTVSIESTTVKAHQATLEGALAAEFIPDTKNPKFKQFIEDFKAKYGSEPTYQGYMATVYDSVYLLKDGITKVGYDGTKLAQWSRTIKDWSGVSGTITIGANGDPVSGHSPIIIQNGQHQPYTK